MSGIFLAQVGSLLCRWVALIGYRPHGSIPSRRVLLEGGYEADSRPWNPDLEERTIAKVHELFQRASPAAASPE